MDEPDDTERRGSPRRRLDPRAIVRIARWETAGLLTSVDRRVLIGTIVALLLLGGTAGAVLISDAGLDVGLDDGLYSVGIADDHPLQPAVNADRTLTAHPPDREAFDARRIDLLIAGSTVRGHDSPKSRAAVDALRSAIETYNDRYLAGDPNQSAAFPVSVSVEYVGREPAVGGAEGDAGGADASNADGGTDTSSDGGSPDESSGDSGGTDAPNQGGDGSQDAAETAESAEATTRTATPDTDGPIAAPGLGTGPLFAGGDSGTPSDIEPPFPFESLILAFLFVVPMNFVIQAYGSTILAERLNRRGEVLLVAPVSRFDIIAGKTLPYLAVMIGVAAITALAIGGGLLSIAAVTPLALTFLGATFVGAMFARSFKELTFVTVAVSTGLTAFAFIPAIFASVGSIGLISPLTIVVRELQGTAISPPEFAFSTIPLTAVAAILFGLGASVYRERDMFTQRPLTDKALDALARHISQQPGRSVLSIGVITALSIPFVFVAELLAIALLFALPVTVSIPLLIGVIVAIEEVAKSLHVYAGFSRDRLPRTDVTAAIVGAASGTGFFLAEKATLAVQLIGLGDLAHGQAAFGPTAAVRDSLGPTIPAPVLLGLMLVLPLLLHIVTAVLSASGARYGRRGYAVGLAGAIVVHATYNLSLLVIAGVI